MSTLVMLVCATTAAAALSKRALLMLLKESFARGAWPKVDKMLSRCTDIRPLVSVQFAVMGTEDDGGFQGGGGGGRSRGSNRMKITGQSVTKTHWGRRADVRVKWGKRERGVANRLSAKRGC